MLNFLRSCQIRESFCPLSVYFLFSQYKQPFPIAVALSLKRAFLDGHPPKLLISYYSLHKKIKKINKKCLFSNRLIDSIRFKN